MSLLSQKENNLFSEIKELIQSAKQRAAVTVNAELTILYWQVGKRISEEVLKGERAEYGKQILEKLSYDLTTTFGKGWSKKQLLHCLRFVETFPDFSIVSTLSRQLSWSHFLELIYLKEALARDFYIQMSRIERWSVRELRKQVNSMLFERTAISRQPDKVIDHQIKEISESGKIEPVFVLKDPYILDFLSLNDHYLEKDPEDAILREMEQFLLELGTGFTFVARQRRLQIDNDDFYIDLLFYNRKLKRLVAIDLKIGNFKAEYKGQMELYLRWLAKNEQEAGEESPIGIILCTGKKHEQIELLELDKSGIHVAEYLTILPSKEVLQERLHQAVINARQRIENKSGQGFK